MSYDEALAKAEAIISELEQAPALSMDVYRKKASEAGDYLRTCRQELGKIEKELEA